MSLSHQTYHPKKTSRQRINTFYNSTFAITWDIGVVMIMLAVAGIFDPFFLGMHLNFMHCMVLALGGSLTVWSGVFYREKAYKVNLGLGIFFLANAIVGILVGDRGHLRIGYGTSEDFLVKFAPGFLELSVVDHCVHFVLAALFFFEAYAWRKNSLDFPADIRKW